MSKSLGRHRPLPTFGTLLGQRGFCAGQVTMALIACDSALEPARSISTTCKGNRVFSSSLDLSRVFLQMLGPVSLEFANSELLGESSPSFRQLQFRTCVKHGGGRADQKMRLCGLFAPCGGNKQTSK